MLAYFTRVLGLRSYLQVYFNNIFVKDFSMKIKELEILNIKPLTLVFSFCLLLVRVK